MATKIRKLHAREIIRSARRQKVTLSRGGSFSGLCAIATINSEIFGQQFSNEGNAKENLAAHFDVTVDDIQALEMGFEGWNDICYLRFMKNPYYKVGRNVAKLAGLG